MPATKKTPTAKSPAKPATVRLLVKDNPKRGESRARFAFYRDGLTTDDYVARVVKAGNPSSLARADLRWDAQRKFIAIS
jgi:hypothetical protein